MAWQLIPPGRRKANRNYYVRGAAAGREFEVSARTADREAAARFAERFYAEFVAAIHADDPALRRPHSRPARPSFADAAAAYCAFRDPRPDDRRFLRRICAEIGARDAASIVQADLVAIANRLLPAASNSHKNRSVLDLAGRVLHYAHEAFGVPYLRIRRFKVPRRSTRQPASEATMAALLANTDGAKFLLLATLYETGLRIQDALDLRARAFEPARRALLARIAKTDDAIAITLSAGLAAGIARHLGGGGQAKAAPDAFIFPWRTRWEVYKWLRPLTKKLNVVYTPHMSRHALATELGRRGVPDAVAKDYGAWADARSLHRYQHVQPAPLQGRGAVILLRQGQAARRGKTSPR